MTEHAGQWPTVGLVTDSPSAASEPAPQMRMKVASIGKLNLADFQNAVPALRELAVCNEPATAISELTLGMNFGPLNRDGGERRLNVAVTRARHKLRVFASLRGEQMDLSRTKANDVRDLKHFLEFAERGPRALAEAHAGSVGDFESPFEAGVAAALGRKGWQVQTQIGASSFRVDLGVVHPDFPGRYLAGIECDGATYHRSATARDRDKLREQVLRGLGWEILRIWSTDWWVDPGGTLERVHGALTGLLERDRQRRAEEAAAPEAHSAAEALAAGAEVVPDPQAEDEAEAAIALAAMLPPAAVHEEAEQTPASADEAYARSASADPTAVPLPSADAPPGRRYEAARPADAVPAVAMSADRFHDMAYDEVLQAMVAWVVQREGPVLDTVLARRIARAHGFQRTGNRIQERVERLARQRFKTTEEAGGTFYWPDQTAPGSEVDFRSPGDDESARAVQEICEQELLPLARRVLQSGRTGEDAAIAMARDTGLQSLRAASRGRLEVILEVASR